MFDSVQNFAYRWLARKAAFPYLRAGEVDFQEILRSEGYWSQCGQDKWIVENILKGRENGVFVDVGAHDGVTFSNTYVLEKNHGWTGLAFEPNPKVFEKLQSNRKCQCVNACVNSEPGTVDFQLVIGNPEMLSGIVDSYQEKHKLRIQREVQEFNGSLEIIKVPSVRLSDYLELQSINFVDYMSIDVEGAELRVLNSIDFSKTTFKVIGIENNYHDWRIPAFLFRKGFRFHSIVGDEFYINSKLF